MSAAKLRNFAASTPPPFCTRDPFCSNIWREFGQANESSSFKQGAAEKLNTTPAARLRCRSHWDRSHWIRSHIPLGPLLAMTLSGGSCRQHP
jgi:hypothetical protein